MEFRRAKLEDITAMIQQFDAIHYRGRLLASSRRLFVLRTASISVLGFERETRGISRWNLLHKVGI